MLQTANTAKGRAIEIINEKTRPLIHILSTWSSYSSHNLQKMTLKIPLTNHCDKDTLKDKVGVTLKTSMPRCARGKKPVQSRVRQHQGGRGLIDGGGLHPASPPSRLVAASSSLAWWLFPGFPGLSRRLPARTHRVLLLFIFKSIPKDLHRCSSAKGQRRGEVSQTFGPDDLIVRHHAVTVSAKQKG